MLDWYIRFILERTVIPNGCDIREGTTEDFEYQRPGMVELVVLIEPRAGA